MISPVGIRLIKGFESFSPILYLCPAQVWSVGFGHVVKPGEVFDLPLSPESGEIILLRDVSVAERAISRLIHVPLSQNQWDAITSFVFNLGSGALQASMLRQVINRGDLDEAPTQIRRWVYAGGRKLKGLIARREIEARLFACG
jgi:lysozyme